MSLTLKTKPATEPVTLTEAKAWIKVTDSASDAQITSLIIRAREYAEIVCQRALLGQTWVLRFDYFPSHVIRLPRPLLQTVTSVKYYDTSDVQQTFSASLYQADIYSEPGLILPVDGQSWPSTFRRVNAVEIEYVAGYADAATVPQTIKDVILMLVDHWFEHRGAVTELRLAEPPISVHDMLWPYRVW